MAKFYSLLILFLLMLGSVVLADATFTLSPNPATASVGDTVTVTLAFDAGGAVNPFSTAYVLTSQQLTFDDPAGPQCGLEDNSDSHILNCDYMEAFAPNSFVITARVVSVPITINLEQAYVDLYNPNNDDESISVNVAPVPPLIIPAANAAAGGGVPAACQESWACSDFSNCANGQETRTCEDTNHCGTQVSQPVPSRACVDGPSCHEGTHNEGGSCVADVAPLSQEDLLAQLETVLGGSGLNRLQQISHIARLLMQGGVQ